MREILQSATFQLVFWPVAGLIALVFLTFLALIFAASRNRRAVQSAAREIQDLRGLIGWADLTKVEDALPKSRVFREQWEEFKESLTDLESQPHNSMGIDRFIRDHEFLQSVRFGFIRFPVVHYLPGMASSLGILGTFIGITVGLGNLDIGSGDDSSIKVLVMSLSGAFVTSILGVFTSLVINVVAGWKESSLLGALHEFHEVVERKIPRVTSERLLSINLRYQERRLDVLNTHGEILDAMRRDAEESRVNLQAIAHDMADSISNRFDSTIQEYLVPRLQQMTDVVRTQVSSAGQNSEQQARRFADEMVQQISGSLQTSFQAMGDQVSAVSERFSTSVQSLDEVIANTAEAMTAQREILSDSRSAVAEAQGRSAAAAHQIASVEELAAQLAGLMDGLVAQQSQATAVLNQQAQLQQSSERSVSHVAESVGQAAQAYGQVAGDLGGVIGKLEPLVSQLTSSVGQLSAATGTASTTVEQASQSLVKRTIVEERLLVGLEQASGKFANALEAGGPLVGGLTRAAETFSAQQRETRDLVGRMTELASALGVTSGIMRDGLSTAEQALRRSATSIAKVVEETEAWSRDANEAIEGFAGSVKRVVEDSLREYDKSLSEAVSGLRVAMQQLEDTAEEIAASAAARRPR